MRWSLYATSVYEKFYSYIYNNGYRINSVKEDILKETSIKKVLFHGSKRGLENMCFNKVGKKKKQYSL